MPWQVFLIAPGIVVIGVLLYLAFHVRRVTKTEPRLTWQERWLSSSGGPLAILAAFIAAWPVMATLEETRRLNAIGIHQASAQIAQAKLEHYNERARAREGGLAAFEHEITKVGLAATMAHEVWTAIASARNPTDERISRNLLYANISLCEHKANHIVIEMYNKKDFRFVIPNGRKAVADAFTSLRYECMNTLRSSPRDLNAPHDRNAYIQNLEQLAAASKKALEAVDAHYENTRAHIENLVEKDLAENGGIAKARDAIFADLEVLWATLSKARAEAHYLQP